MSHIFNKILKQDFVIYDNLSRRFKLCTSIPVVSPSDDDDDENGTLIKVKEAIDRGTDFVELRFDFLKSFDDLEVLIKSISEYKQRSIFTLRSKNQGGYFEMDDAKRIEILKKLSQANPLFVDIEYDFISKETDFADWLENSNTRVLVSWHDFTKTPPKQDLMDLITNMRVFSNFIKIVTTAKSIEDSIKIIELYDLVDTQINLIAFAMGDLGTLTRVLCPLVGDVPFNYVSLDKALAPGQLNVNQMNTINKLLKKRLI